MAHYNPDKIVAYRFIAKAGNNEKVMEGVTALQIYDYPNEVYYRLDNENVAIGISDYNNIINTAKNECIQDLLENPNTKYRSGLLSKLQYNTKSTIVENTNPSIKDINEFELDTLFGVAIITRAQLIESYTQTNIENIDVSNLEPGIYLFKDGIPVLQKDRDLYIESLFYNFNNKFYILNENSDHLVKFENNEDNFYINVDDTFNRIINNIYDPKTNPRLDQFIYKYIDDNGEVYLVNSGTITFNLYNTFYYLNDELITFVEKIAIAKNWNLRQKNNFNEVGYYLIDDKTGEVFLVKDDYYINLYNKVNLEGRVLEYA